VAKGRLGEVVGGKQVRRSKVINKAKNHVG